jgi:hypothetical protein
MLRLYVYPVAQLHHSMYLHYPDQHSFVLVDDIVRYEQLSNREKLLGLASALAGNEAVLVHTLDPIDPVDVTGIQIALKHKTMLIRIM